MVWCTMAALYTPIQNIQFGRERKEEEEGETRWPETKRSLNRQRELLRWQRGKRTLKRAFFSLHFGGDSCHDILDIQDQRVYMCVEE